MVLCYRRGTPDSRANGTRAEDQLLLLNYNRKNMPEQKQSKRSEEGEVASEPDLKPLGHGVYMLEVELLTNLDF